MNCPVCNKPIKENDTFCSTCGSAFTSQQLAFTTVKENPITKAIGFWKFFFLMLINIIPVVNIIVNLILSFKPLTNLNIKSFSKASLVYTIIYTIALAAAIRYFMF